MLRRWTVATWAAAWYSPVYFSRIAGFATISFRVNPAPSVVPEPFATCFSAPIRASETSVAGVWWRRFMFGSKSVPPAMSIACGPSAARIFAASATVAGERKPNHGSRIMLRLPSSPACAAAY
jgi:hypothetical protein